MIFMPKGRRSRKKAAESIGRGEKPEGVAIIAVLEIVAAVFAIFAAIGFGIVANVGLGSFYNSVAGFGSGALILCAVVLLVSAYGLWKGTKWGWWLGMIVAVLVIIFTFITIIGIVAGLLVLYYLTRKKVRKWFRLN
jgi:branched-subunit amino acid transport protein